MSVGQNQFKPGKRLGDFEILEEIGRGGMGSVYLAEDTRLRRKVALKVILPELADQPDFRRRFEAEARGAAAIEHPNLVRFMPPGYSRAISSWRCASFLAKTSIKHSISTGRSPVTLHPRS